MKLLSFLYLKFKHLLKIKIKFINPTKVDILLLDDGFANLKFDKNYATKLIKDEIYILIFLKAFIQFIFSSKKKNFHNLYDTYFKSLIYILDPKIGIGHEINLKILVFKYLFPEKISIMYQMANQSSLYKKTVTKLLRGDRPNLPLKSDYFLVNREWDKFFFDFVDTKFIEVGSVKNNEMKTKSASKKYDIMFVSQFRQAVPSYWDTNNNLGSMRTLDSATSYLMRILNEYCEKKEKKICIALCVQREDKKNRPNRHKMNINDEIDFFSRDLKNFHYEKISSYDLAEKSEIVITINSTLGLDLLARYKKILFIDLHYYLGGSPLDPIVSSKEGFFWYQGQEPDIIKRKIDNMLQIRHEDWIKQLDESKLKMKFDPDNTILKNLVSKLLKN